MHDWYRFVLSYPPHLVRHYVKRFGLGPNSCLLDPFCGTGTTLVECKKLGVPSVGIEATPMAHLASGVKIDWARSSSSLLRHAERVAGAATAQLKTDGVTDSVLPLFRQGKTRRPFKSLPPEVHTLLLSNSISPLPAHKALTLLECIDRDENTRYRDFERLALAKVLVTRAGNVRFGPEVGVGRPKEDAEVVGPWLEELRAIAADLSTVKSLRNVTANVYLADSRSMEGLLPRASVDAVITSPPYPNEKDYTRTTRLESVFLGFIRSKHDLRELKRTLVRSNTRGVYKADGDDAFVAEHEEIQRIAAAIESRRVELGKTSGFERLYHRVAQLYFGGMTRHFADLREILKPGAQLAYVVGDQASYLRVMIRTGQLLADIAKSLGYEVLGFDLFRHRLATATGEMLREEVVLLRWPGSINSDG